MRAERIRRWSWSLAFAAIGVLVLSGVAAAAAAPSTTSAPAASAVTAATTAPHLPTPIKHVVFIMMENEETAVIYGNQPYETQLANTYAWGGDANSNPSGTGYYAVCHPSAPNYLAVTSGKTLQCGSDNFNTYPVNNLGNLLDTANDSWVAYQESATVPCQQYNSGLYVVRHDPFAYYSDLGGNTSGSECESHVVPIANLTNDYPYNATPPSFTWITPNILNDAHSSSAAVGDYWLSTFVPKLIAAPWFSSSVIFITYDEAYKANGNYNVSGYNGLHGGPVYMVAISPYTLGVGPLTADSSHYNLLTTMEWLLGLPSTGTGHDGTLQYPALTGLFQSRLFGPAKHLAYTNLAGADLAGYDLRADGLQYANLSGANLAGANLAGADLQYADLAGANLQGANLRGANLQYADLAGANLRGADLKGADLRYADLGWSELTGLGATRGRWTNFDGANLDYAVLSHAVCGSPNYIVAAGASLNAIGVPTTCAPPL